MSVCCIRLRENKIPLIVCLYLFDHLFYCFFFPVFVNPRSGGNQGLRLIQKFNFYLNPRQVFDLGAEGPRKGLELYKKVSIAILQ